MIALFCRFSVKSAATIRLFCTKRNTIRIVAKYPVFSADQLMKKLFVIRNHPNHDEIDVNSLCSEVEHFALSMTAEQAVQAIVVLNDLKESKKSDAKIALRNIIEINIAELNLEATLLLDDLCFKNDFLSTIQTTLPMLFERDLMRQFEFLTDKEQIHALIFALNSFNAIPNRAECIQFIIERLLCNKPNISIEQITRLLSNAALLSMKEDVISNFISFIDQSLVPFIDVLSHKTTDKLLYLYSEVSRKPNRFAQKVIERISQSNELFSDEILLFWRLNECVSKIIYFFNS